MNDFASAAMVTIIRRGLARQGITPDAPARLTAPKATIPLADKRQLLLGIYEQHGALALLRIGQAIEEVRHEPALNALLRAQSPLDLLERWQRLERYVHSRHRCVIEETGDRYVVVRHISLTPDTAPHATEDILVMGVMIALLEANGCDGLGATFSDCRLRHPALSMDGRVSRTQDALERPSHDTDTSLCDAGDPVYADGKFHESGTRAIRDTGIWRFSWTSYDPANQQGTHLVPEKTSVLEITNKCSAIISGDIAHRWSLSTLAACLNVSVRTLQRRLSEVPVKFQEIVRAVQLREASRLLLDTRHELTEIGFCCGFSDYPHFSREFKKHTNLSPSEFRRKFATTPQSSFK